MNLDPLIAGHVKQEILHIPAMSARAFSLKASEVVRITDTEGGQPGDLVAFNLQDRRERFSQARTRVEHRACRVTAGHSLWSNAVCPRPMLTITADIGGGHDLLYAACCRYALLKRFHTDRDGCQEQLAAALASWHISPLEIPAPLNLFFRIEVAPDGTLIVGTPVSTPGAFVELRAEMDCLLAISTCPVPRPGRSNSGYSIIIQRSVGTPA